MTAGEEQYAATSLRATRALGALCSSGATLLARSAVFRSAFFAQIRARPWRLPPADAAAEVA